MQHRMAARAHEERKKYERKGMYMKVYNVVKKKPWIPEIID